MSQDAVIIIPARIGSTRLPRKLLEKIGDATVIEHVVKNCMRADIGHIIVATDDLEIANIVSSLGAMAIMTDSDCPTGSDRVYQALQKVQSGRMQSEQKIKYVINVQGDMPFLDARAISDILSALKGSQYDIVTPVVKIGMENALSESNVKVVADNDGRALYFSRSLIPHGSKEFLYHVGIYGYKSGALEKFVSLPKGRHEICESLEQLRALENGMSIGVVEVNQIPVSIDTYDDLTKARSLYENEVKVR